MFDITFILEPVGMFCGMIGAIFISVVDLKYRMIGYLIWVISNFAWIIYALIVGDIWIGLQFLFYLGTTGFGIYNIVKYKRKIKEENVVN